MLDRQTVIVITPDMVGGHHDWRVVNHWHHTLWTCRRCKMQVRNRDPANARPCLATKKGWCRICHERGYSKTSLYCRRHRAEAWSHNRVPRLLPDDAIFDLHRQGVSRKEIGEKLGVSPRRAGEIIRQIDHARYQTQVRDLEDRLGPCACGTVRIWIFDHPNRSGSVVCSGCREVRLEYPEASERAESSEKSMDHRADINSGDMMASG